MKKLLLLTVLLSLLLSCNGRKQIEKALHSGNYNQAISNALKKLETNKDKKRKEDYILLLRDAYYKANERDLASVKHLKKDGNPENYQSIYDIYSNLDARQEAIKPFLPLQVNGKTIHFKLDDYASNIAEAKANLSNYLYTKSKRELQSFDKQTIREAYNTFEYIDKINPNYKDVRNLMDEAYQKGTDYVIVTIENQTNQVIPRRLEDDLLNFDTYGLDQFWTVYHASKNANIAYDYAMELQLKRINISPERMTERELLRQKQVKDGWKYQLDSNGNVMKDSLGNDIKIDKIITAKARFNEISQSKSTQIIANVVYSNLKTRQTLKAFPITSEFVFENIFATYRGDKRALDYDDLRLLDNRRVMFPSNEQMIFDTGEDLKQKLKQIISSYKL
jgi:tetratricopeptide (TPR) repeat protein